MSYKQVSFFGLSTGMRRAFVLVGLFILLWWPGRSAQADTSSVVESRRAQLQTQLDQLEQQISGYETLITSKHQEAASLQRDIAIINAEIARAKLEIKRKDLLIGRLAGTIQQKNQTILQMQDKIDREKASLAEAMRKLYEHDDLPLAEALLMYKDLADFFNQTETIDSLQLAIQVSASNLRDQIDTETKTREDLEVKKGEQVQLQTLRVIEKKNQEKKEAERQQVLKVTRGQESQYQKIAQQKKKDAAQIRSQLFLLQGSPAIPFERALEYANFASLGTGVRPAFILGIISQESELGQNIGQCNLPNDPPEYKWQQVMHTRDRQPYLAITAELGLDPEQMPVSCPMRGSNGKRIGWGGAMGPAQFIPSTWVLYKDNVAAITKVTPPNPWTPKDAFVASALLSKDNGASGGPEAERKAAAKYFAGSNWNSSLGRSYASQVLAKADKYQEQITFLQSLVLR